MVKKRDKGSKQDLSVIPNTVSMETSDFFDYVASVIEQSRSFVGRTADLTMSVTYFEIGRMIVEKEQGGKDRADYGQGLIKRLSEFLTDKFKKGFSVSSLKNAKQFYVTYRGRIGQTFSSQLSDGQKSQKLSSLLPTEKETRIQQTFSVESDGYEAMKKAAQFFRLSWSHYTFLMRIENEDERRFYEIEAEREGWTYHHLKRQYHSSLYERLALSKDKNEVMRLSHEGQTVEKPGDILKRPLVLEFLVMTEDSSYMEQ